MRVENVDRVHLAVLRVRGDCLNLWCKNKSKKGIVEKHIKLKSFNPPVKTDMPLNVAKCNQCAYLGI